jgi:hypothetical protein
MPKWVGEPTLPMYAPRRVVIREALDVARPSIACPLDELIRVLHEYLNPSRAEPGVNRLRSVILPGTASCRKKGAPSTSRPATPPRSQSSVAPSAALYHRTAACASGTISITERDVGGVAPFIAPASYVASDHLLPRSRACSERHPFAQLRASRRTIAHARSGRKRSSARVDQARFCSSWEQHCRRILPLAHLCGTERG